MTSILIVDDEEKILRGLERVLRPHFTIATAQSPAMAIKKTLTNKFQVVVLDQHMPELNGLDLADKLRDINSELIFILLTGDLGLETAKKAYEAGSIFKYLTKPCDSDKLVAVIKKASAMQKQNQVENELDALRHHSQPTD